MKKQIFTCITLLFATVLSVQQVMSQTAGSPSGNGVQPTLIAGNPDCGDIGLGFGFKIDQAPNGTFELTSANGSLTGGGIEDANNSITLANSNGSYFDWIATLGIDAVIVKAGPNADAYVYSPESLGDTDLHGPINPNNNQPYVVSHIEFCYDYEVDIEKGADTGYKRTWDWDITKDVIPEKWDLFTGDAGTSQYTVTVDKAGFIDSDWAVSGEITIENNTPYDAGITGVSDDISGVGAVSVDCGVTFPYTLLSGNSLTCSYSSALPDGSARTNTATVTTTGIVGGGNATADVIFGEPTTEVNASVSITDSNGESWGPVSDDATWTYDRTFTCYADEGTHDNTASIDETGDSDYASVTVNCYTPTVEKDATPALTRTWDWTIDKSANQTSLTLATGQQFSVNYTIDVDATATDSDWGVSGDITISNPNPTRSASLTAVADIVSPAIAATVSCPGLSIPPGGSVICAYVADLPDATNRTNTATATLQNYSFASDGTPTINGTTDISGSAEVDFSTATINKVDECVDVTDSYAGTLGTVCGASSPTSFVYTRIIGPYDICGDYTVPNTASFTTNDTGAQGSDDWTIAVNVPCYGGCTLTPGYWKTHSEFGPAPDDDTWALLSDGASTAFFLSGQTYYEVLWTAPQGNAYYILAHAYIAAELNFINEADPSDVQTDFDEATALFETYSPEVVAGLKGQNKKQWTDLATILDDYNNGFIGPGHCSEEGESSTSSRIAKGKSSIKDLITEAEISVLSAMTYPNPFENKTLIRFAVPNDTEVTLDIFNLVGERLTTLLNTRVKGGQWHEVIFDASNIKGDLFIYRLHTSSENITGKLIRAK